MAEPATQEWPDHRLKVMVPIWSLLTVSTAFLVWRIAYGIKSGRRFLACDYLLIVACCLNIAATSLTQVIIGLGLGRHIMDPSVLPNMRQYSYVLWIDQILNVIAVAFLKWSICAWLMILNFSKTYQVIVWLSILMVTALNFLAPVLTFLGCVPLEKNWNFAYQGSFKCWAVGGLKLSYTQGVSNIVTDIVYMAAPLVYLSNVQLSRRTQLGIRVVFLLSIPATICSIFKTIELHTIFTSRDPTWDGMNITIWSQAELSLGIMIASLPPLRKAFISIFQRILPSTTTSSRKTPYSGQGYGQGRSANGNIIMDNLKGSKAYHSHLHGESVLDADDDSDRAILEEEPHRGPGILKSMTVSVDKASVNSNRV
ncbi:uncharacterized protein M421DRAFT_55219 [Didymella exigua CBS 183.55]|uniref:Rhodopsin domain-containing protein n=1 Tax=Didymella exigua CBS 183.55 TaxID=1150837 RepID=A0A6A5RVK8_9PLEO|nr:uncharacterized protein M421DRAFT_55219 [Didymella exigua CBS 183.55]KAF1931902.1 hypothetical protein M421DRAFT_55219 [Didymella exigua CBS 183.55]